VQDSSPTRTPISSPSSGVPVQVGCDYLHSSCRMLNPRSLHRQDDAAAEYHAPRDDKFLRGHAVSVQH
jgi:hypothetical protein